MNNNFNTFYKTFSGADTIVFIAIPNTTPIVLGSLTTISYSTYRVKRPVSTLSRVNVAGFTRGQRTVAGTLIFTLINQHWVNEVSEAIKCLDQFDRLKPDELPLFDLMLVSANEYGSGVVGYIYGVDITDDSGVISINDFYTETTVSFLARDIDLLKDYKRTVPKLETKGDVVVDNYVIDVNGSSQVELKSNAMLLSTGPSIQSLQVSSTTYDININSLVLGDIIYTYDSSFKINIFAKSYYQNNVVTTYINTVESNVVTVRDIVTALLYNSESKSYPKYIDCVFSQNGNLAKIKIKVGEL